MRRIYLICLCFLVGALPVRGQDPVPAPEFTSEVQTDEGDRLHVRADYLYWWLRRLKTPPLLTAGPAGSSAIIGEPGTVILRGDRITSRHDRYIGIRAGIDYWFGEDRDLGVEADVFFMERDSTHFTVRPGNVPVLAIPFVGNQGRNNSFVISGFNRELGDLIGGTRVYSRMELFGQEANLLYRVADAPEGEWILFAGTRFLQLRERLDLTSSARVLPAQSTVVGLEDHLQTFDKFYGGQVGAIGKRRWGAFSVEGRAAVALGANDQLIRNKGERIFHTPQERQTQPHGLFVLPTNRGAFSRVSFDMVTELRLKLGWDVTRFFNVHAGYSLLTWDGPVRPGDQIVPINQSQIRPGGLQGPVQPLPQFREDFFWAHGANVGMEFRW